MLKIITDIEIRQILMDSYVCLETGGMDLLSNNRSLRNSIELTIEPKNFSQRRFAPKQTKEPEIFKVRHKQ